VGVTYLPGGKINIGQGIKLINDNVNIVWADTMAETHYRLAFIYAAYRMEFP
jgi:hypothetical protein